MNLVNARVLIAAQYAAPYEGNFIASLKNLQNRLADDYNAICTFAFPFAMASQPWAENFISNNEVYLTGASNALISKTEASDIINKFKPTLIYTHFEGYDRPMAYAAARASYPIRQVWHMHDTLAFHPNIVKAAYQLLAFFKHYGLPMMKKHGGVKPCLISVCKHELKFIKKFRFGWDTSQTVIPNGINISRIHPQNNKRHNTFTFLAFAGRNVQKRVDLLLLAADKLIKTGYKLKVVIVDGHKPSVADTIFDIKPEWLTEINPQEDINQIFSLADCFVSTSVHETFSYAIAEASIFGLPVIQSDIEGTMWNAANPSSFLFKSEDISGLEKAMLKVMEAPSDELVQACNTTRENNIRDYSIDSWSNKIMAFFENIP